jgi:hypothetical protein
MSDLKIYRFILTHVFGDTCAYPSLYLYVIELSLVYFIIKLNLDSLIEILKASGETKE